MIAEAERLSPLVARVLAPNPSPMTLQGTNTYLVGLTEVAVIDPGPDLPEHVDAIVESLRRCGTPAYSVVTHHHEDHLPAARRLRERLDVPIVGHPDLPGVDRPLGHNAALQLQGAKLTALHTPGHTWDHICYFLDTERALFTGDLIAGTGSIRVGEGRGELAAYLKSLELVAARDPAVIFPGHGPMVPDAAGKIAEYLAHRREREREVLAALGDGDTRIVAIVMRMYPDVGEFLQKQAARNVQSHLFKLEDDGLVQSNGDAWSLTLAGSDAG